LASRSEFFAPPAWPGEGTIPHAIADHALCGALVCEAQETVLLQNPFYTLLRFGYGEDAAARVLVVAPLSGIGAPLLYDMLTDLQPGCDLHALVWTDPVGIPVWQGPFGLDHNIAAVLDALRVLGAGTHVIGLCQSALPVLAAASILSADTDPVRPASLILIGGKLDTRIHPTRVDNMIRNCPLEVFERRIVTTVAPPDPGHGRLVYPACLQEAMMLSYVGRHMMSGGEIFRKMLVDDGDDAATHAFIRLLLSAVAVPGEFFLDTVSLVFQNSALPRGELRWRNLPVEPAAITDTALLTVEATEDDIAGPGQTYVAHALCSRIPAERRAHVLQPDIGHFGLFHGLVWRRRIRPQVLTFIREHDRQRSAA
jgi:poly(3-hydroxybutyrate) depolymerase